MATKLNVNIRTLLANCEELSKDEVNFWRLKKFIKSLDTMIDELQSIEDSQSSNKIEEYSKRLQNLKTITNYVEKPSSPTTRHNKQPGAGISMGLDYGNDAITEMKQLQSAKVVKELRKDLFSNIEEDTLRRRKADDSTVSDNMNEAVKYYTDAQEKIAEHMLSLTRNLREQTETANRIIKRDTEIVSSSANMTDRNINSLDKETEKLQDHSRNAWKCWMWMMIVFVIFVFVGMVLFMKIVKKKKL